MLPARRFLLVSFVIGAVGAAATLRGPARHTNPIAPHEGVEQVVGNLTPLAQDALKRLGDVPMNARDPILLQGLHSFFTTHSLKDKVSALYQALKHYRAEQKNLLQSTSDSASAASPAAAPPAAAPVPHTIDIDSVRIPQEPEPAPSAVLTIPEPALEPPVAPVVPPPPPTIAENAMNAQQAQTVNVIDGATNQIQDSVHDLSTDIDHMFKMIDDLEWWKVASPHMSQAVETFAASYRESLGKLVATTHWKASDGPPPFHDFLLHPGPAAAPAAPGAPGAPSPAGAPGAAPSFHAPGAAHMPAPFR